MEFRQVIKVIIRYKHIIFTMCLSAIITAILLTYVLSEKYQSSTTVLIRPKKSVDLVPKSKEILDFPVGIFTSVAMASKTYTEIIKSRTIAESVVKKLGIDTLQEEEKTGLSYYWQMFKKMVKEFIIKTWILLKHGRIEDGDPYDDAVNKVQDSISVNPTKNTFLFELQVESKSPVFASAIANTATLEFVNYLEELNSAENIRLKLLSSERLELSRQRLEESRLASAEFKEKHGIVSLAKDAELELELLSDLKNSTETINAKMAGLEAKKEEIKRKITELENFPKSAIKVAYNPLVMELYSQLASKEVRYTGLRKRFAPAHREVQTLQAEIDEIKAKLEKESPTLHSEDTLSVDPVYQELLSTLVIVETSLESMKAEKNRLALSIQEKKSFFKQFPEIERELTNLKLTESMNEETHQIMTREYEELVANANKNRPDITIVSYASPAVYPFRPIKIYHALLAGILSLIAGIGIAFLMENTNITIRSIEEAEQKLALPVIMTIPHLDVTQNNFRPLINPNKKMLLDKQSRQERAYVQYPVEIRRQEGLVTGHGVVSDLSSGGICCYVESKMSLKPEDKVEISVIINEGSGDKAVLEGVVLRSKTTIAGYHFSTTAIQFVNVNDATAKKIEMIIQGTKGDALYSLPPYFEEPIRGLRSDMLFMRSQGMSSFLITSCGPQEGKSTIVSNLALSLAEINKKVIVIDANLRSPRIHKILQLPNESGLSSILSSGAHPYMKKTKSGVCILTSGPPIDDPSALLGSYNMLKLFKSLNDEFDFILFDSPALLAGPDSALLASIVHGAIVVLNAGSTTVEDVRRAKQILDRSNAKTLGIVMNNFEDELTSYYTWS